MKVRRNKCKCVDCDYDCLERISFAPGSHSYTRRFARYVVDLLKGMTFKYTESLINSYSPSSLVNSRDTHLFYCITFLLPVFPDPLISS